MKVAVAGASGFIGLRLVERLHLGGKVEVVPVVRGFSSLAVLSRFDLDWHVCDALDAGQLKDAFAGCDAVVHAAIGDAGQIVGMAESIYRAADAAGVERLVVLSSASVHGQAPEMGTDETSPLNLDHELEYNTAKVKAERLLRDLEAEGEVKTFLLRPGVVYGPRSRWIFDMAGEIARGRVYVIDGGTGVFNGIYVDNLVDAIECCLTAEGGYNEAFLVGDAETVSWMDSYSTLAAELKLPLPEYVDIEPPRFRKSTRQRIDRIAASQPVQRLLPMVPDRAKRLVKASASAWDAPSQPESGWTLREEKFAPPTQEMSLLMQCRWKLPHGKAESVLGYAPRVSFSEGMARSTDWLRFAGWYEQVTDE